MISAPYRLGVLCLAPLLFIGAISTSQPTTDDAQTNARSTDMAHNQDEGKTMKIQYLEIVTPSVDETCEVLALAHGVAFSDPIAELGNARTAELKDGGRVGVRAPMRDTEQPVVRPYVLVDDIRAAVSAAEKIGAEVAIPPMKIPGQGTFSIYILGGIEHGLWQE